MFKSESISMFLNDYDYCVSHIHTSYVKQKNGATQGRPTERPFKTLYVDSASLFSQSTPAGCRTAKGFNF